MEIIFGYPGLGKLIYLSFYARDYPLLEAVLVLSIIIVIIGKLVCEIINSALSDEVQRSSRIET
ncbi:hypothetical protein AKJ65_01460 [candidate division MSBL1 archaeon SCGC-AAA259E19]|uniref:ABC transmembrane type-1 domain-containing protein n=1 Tax=candidate division MSBL1 archaeon SCGC-AAA259E19 TaxID=1698264 RepID=A0A133UN89_9EURY|nr:hypothetical protein AKJ65_01460 [candidate division MSBL1 archaeon SCGC-AAA259E19]